MSVIGPGACKCVMRGFGAGSGGAGFEKKVGGCTGAEGAGARSMGGAGAGAGARSTGAAGCKPGAGVGAIGVPIFGALNRTLLAITAPRNKRRTSEER